MNTNQISSNYRHIELVEWSENLTIQTNSTTIKPTAGNLQLIFEEDLKKYFSLCGLARSSTANQELRNIADSRLFSAWPKIR